MRIGNHRVRLGQAVVALTIVPLSACGDDTRAGPPAPDGAPCAVAKEGAVTIVAESVAWDVDCLRATAGAALTITVENRDLGVNHNLRITGLPSQPGTDLDAGPVTQELTLPAEALTPGDHAFVCDIHPNMTGTLEVREAEPDDGVSVTTPR